MPSSSNSIGDPACPLCGGRGFVARDVPVDHPEFGRALPCVCAEPKLQAARQRQMNALGALEMLAEMTFASFRPDGIALSPEQQTTLRAAYEAARLFAAQPRGWLLLTGGFGVGKTHLAAAIGNEVTERGGKPLFVLAPDLLDHLRSTFGPRSEETYDELFDRLKEAPLLILDDLGAEASSAWAQEKLFQLLNHRYLRRLPTVITSNKPLIAIEPRIRSRLMDIDLVLHMQLLAADYRGGGYVDYMVELSELDKHTEQTFGSFEIPSTGKEVTRQNLLEVRTKAWEYAQEPRGWLALLGPSLVGKTHLAAAIANHVRNSQPKVLFVSIPRLLDHLRAAFAPNSSLAFDVRFEQVKEAPLLVLDDFRGYSSSVWAEEKLFQLIDYRYLTSKPTVFTISCKNATLTELNHADARIVARLQDEILSQMYFIQNSGRPPRQWQKSLWD